MVLDMLTFNGCSIMLWTHGGTSAIELHCDSPIRAVKVKNHPSEEGLRAADAILRGEGGKPIHPLRYSCTSCTKFQ